VPRRIEMSKKVWRKPEFIVLAKSTPGEDILTVCKSVHGTVMVDGVTGTGQTCKVQQGVCGACQSEGGKGGS
jgi:hypothetical protein